MAIDDLISKAVATQRENGLRQAVTPALDANPETAAQADNLARRFGVPHDTAERNLPTLATRAKVEDMDFTGIADRSPGISSFLTDPINAKIAHDDIPELQAMELQIRTRLRDIAGSVPAGAVQGTGGGASGSGQLLQAQQRNLPMRPGLGIVGWALETIGQPVKDVGESIGPSEYRQGVRTDIANAVGQFIPQAAASIAGGPIAAYSMMLGQGADIGYESADRFGGKNRDLVAVMYGGFTAIAEKFGLDAMMRGIPAPVRAKVAEVIFETAEKVGLDPKGIFAAAAMRAGDTAYAGGIEAVSEATEGFLQNLTDKLLLDENKDLLDGLGYQAGIGGASGAIIGGMISLFTRGHARMNVENHEDKSKQASENLKSDIEAVRKPKTAARSPDRMQKLVGEIAGDEDLFFSGPQMASLFQAINPEQRQALIERLDGIEEKIALAAATGSDVSIPRAEFLAKVAPLPVADQMTPLVKDRPEELSTAELADPAAVRALEDQFAKEAEGSETPEVREARLQLQEKIAADLVRTGVYTKSDSAAVAKLGAQFYVNTFGAGGLDAYQQNVQIGVDQAPGSVSLFQRVKNLFGPQGQDANPPLRSTLLDAAGGLKQSKGTGQQMLQALRNTPGVKEEEIGWTGLDEFLAERPSVTKEEIAEYLQQNKLDMGETRLGGGFEPINADQLLRVDILDEENETLTDSWYWDVPLQLRDEVEYVLIEEHNDNEYEINVAGNVVVSELGLKKALQKLQEHLTKNYGVDFKPSDDSDGATRFHSYTLPGGENYREVLLTMPNPGEKLDVRRREIEALGQAATPEQRQEWADIMNQLRPDNRDVEDNKRFFGSPDFRSMHFDQPNILAHVRLNDRTDVDGNRVLFIEEIQSDWHQAGRKKGYTNAGPSEQQKQLTALTNEYDAWREDHNLTIGSADEHMFDEALTKEQQRWLQSFSYRWEKAARAADNTGESRGAVPDAPFKKTWHEMAFRRVAQMAATQGYDRIAWTTGEQQNERYDLSKQIDSLRITKREDGQYALDAIKGGSAVVQEVRPKLEDFEDVIGKDATTKAIERFGGKFVVVNKRSGNASSPFEAREEAQAYIDGLPESLRKDVKIEPREKKLVELSGLDLKIGGSGMKGFYDNIIVKYANKFGKKFGAQVGTTKIPTETVTDEDRALLAELHDEDAPEPQGDRQVKQTVHSMDITDAMRAAAFKGFELFQGGPTDYRGFITPQDAGRYMVTLSKGRANKTTILHEMAHLFMFQIRDGFQQGTLQNWRVWTDAVKYFGAHADQVVKKAARMGATITEADVAALVEGGFVPKGEGQQAAFNAAQEIFAEGFEKYLQGGKTAAPSLRRLFQTFKRWLTQVYGTIAEKDQLDPELVAVFDRMLATEEQVEAAAAELSYRPLERSQFDGSDQDYADYRQQWADGTEAAKETLLTQYLDNLDDERSEDWQKRETAMRAEVTAEIEAEPVYNAIRSLSEGKLQSGLGRVIKLDKKQIIKRYGQAMIGKLNRHAPGASKTVYSVANGYDIDEVAELLGYQSGDEMVRAMAEAEPIDAYIENSTTWRMREKYGNPDPDEEAARVAIRNDKRALALATELDHLGRKIGIKAQKNTQASAQLAAANIIGRRKVRDATSPATFLAAERRAANAAFMAADKGDWRKAYEQKQKQIANYYLWQAARDAEKFEEQAFKKLRFLRKSNADLKNIIDGDYADLIRMMMARIGMRGGDYNAAAAVAKFRQLDQTDQLDMTTVVQFLDTEMPGDYADMTFDDFRDAVHAMLNVNQVGRARREVVIHGEKVVIDDFREQLEDTFNGLLAGKESMVKYNGTMSGRQAAKWSLLQTYAWLRRVEYWATAIEGDNIKGPLHRIVGMVKKAALDYRENEKALNKEVYAIINPVKDAFTGPKIVAPELGGFTFDNLGQVIGMLYHVGNASNLGKLIGGRDEKNTDGSPSWTVEGIQALVERLAAEGVMEKRHMDHVQAIWDLNESLKPKAQAVHKQLYGYRFNEITAEPVNTPWGTYRGGYFPARTDAMLVEDQQIRADQEALTSNNNSFMFPSTGRGFAQSRVENYAEPLDMKADNALAHIQAVNRFIHLQPAVRTAARILNDKALRKTIARVDPHVVKDTLIPWLQRAATQGATGSKLPPRVQSFAKALRRRSSAATMFLNITNTLQQITSLAGAVPRVGAVNLASASFQIARNPLLAIRSAMEMSAQIREGGNSMDAESRAAAQDILNGLVFSEKNGLIKNGRIAVGKTIAIAERHTFIIQTAFQRQIDIVVWTAAFNKALKGKVRELGPTPTDLEAIRYADIVLRETMIKSNPEDQARFERQGPVADLFTLFAGWFNGQLNLYNSTVSRLVREKGIGAAAGIAYATLMMQIFPYVGGQLIVDAWRGGLPDDEDDDGLIDDWASYVFFAMAKGKAAEIPYLGQPLSYLITRAEESMGVSKYPAKLQASALQGTVERSLRSVVTVPEALFGNGDESQAWRDGLTMFQLLTGLPTAGQLARSVGYLADVKEGDTPDPRSAGQLVTGIVGGTPLDK